LPREARLDNIRVVSIQREAAVVRWETHTFDTTGKVHYRATGTNQWRVAEDPNEGSVHAVGLVELKPRTRYELKVEVQDRRGSSTTSEARTFVTAAESRPTATFYVSPDGDDNADGLTPNGAWRTMRQACFSVQPGDTVLVAPGHYHHPIAPITSGLPEKRITFRRQGEGQAVIDGRGVLSALVLLQDKHYVTIDGFHLDPGPNEWLAAPRLVVLNGCRGVEIVNCRRWATSAGGGASSGIYATNCSDLRIEGNVICGARYLLRIFGCRDVLIKNNTLALKSVVAVQLGDSGLRNRGVRFVNNLLYENRSFRNGFLWVTCESSLESDYNLYHTTNARLNLGSVRDGSPNPASVGADLREWRQVTGQDRHSVEADPLFVSPDDRDFRLRPASPAIGAGRNGENIGALGVAR
jgi:hypothetical protein